MHVWFRQYAQQMGMQNTRAILPEQIDLLINTSIQDTINQIIKENINVTNDRIITDNSKIGQINALRSLYTVKLIDLSPKNNESKYFLFNKKDKFTGRISNDNSLTTQDPLNDFLYIVDAAINYKKTNSNIGYTGLVNNEPYFRGKIISPVSASKKYFHDPGYEIKNNTYVDTSWISIGTKSYSVYDPETNDLYSDMIFDVDLSDVDNIKLKVHGDKEYKYLGVQKTRGDLPESIKLPCYRLTNSFENGDSISNNTEIINPLVTLEYSDSGYLQPVFEDYGLETNFFPVRIIDDVYLADTLNDFILKNRLRSPIMVMYNTNNKTIYDIYIDEFHETKIEHEGNAPNTTVQESRYTLQNGLIPYQLRLSYIAKPVEVKYDKDLDGENRDCNLPEYLHVDILKHAVDLYRISISGALQSAKQQEQSAQQENMRNNYRNEGNRQQ